MKKTLCFLTAFIVALGVAGCGTSKTKTTSETSFGVKYTAPEGWTADESDDAVTYRPNKRPGDATIQLIFSELDGINTDNARYYINLFADELDESEMTDVDAFTAIVFDVPVGHAIHADATLDVDGDNHSADMYCTPIKPNGGESGIFALMLTVAPDASDSTSYKLDFADVVSSVDLSGVALPIGDDPAGCDTTVGAVSGEPLSDAAAGLYAKLREKYGNNCLVDTADNAGGICAEYWEDATKKSAKEASWDKIVASVSANYDDWRAYLDDNGCDNPLSIDLMDSDDPESVVLVSAASDGITYNVATDSSN